MNKQSQIGGSYMSSANSAGRDTQTMQNIGWDSGSVSKGHDLQTRGPEFIFRIQHPNNPRAEESETGRQAVYLTW